nr:MAG TPA: hypothetical protein [Caudoviricetes sp.]
MLLLNLQQAISQLATLKLLKILVIISSLFPSQLLLHLPMK